MIQKWFLRVLCSQPHPPRTLKFKKQENPFLIENDRPGYLSISGSKIVQNAPKMVSMCPQWPNRPTPIHKITKKSRLHF